MQLALTVRDLGPEDLTDLEWSGGSEHLNAVAEALMATYTGDVVLLAVALDNGRLIGCGGADLRRHADAGTLWMLSVHETFQGLGVGTLLIRALEDRVRERGVPAVRLTVEHDNPRAAALYRRLGYREVGAAIESWPVSGGRTYVTVCTVLERSFTSSPTSSD
jgi:ribosomal protein S18 acetylase RimI-like enzyme